MSLSLEVCFDFDEFPKLNHLNPKLYLMKK